MGAGERTGLSAPWRWPFEVKIFCPFSMAGAFVTTVRVSGR
jgi:hypothetical protein